MKEFIIVIPARYNSTRLPGKPLVDILGKTMIQRVYEQCTKAVSKECVFVASDDKRILDAVEQFGGQCVLTSSDCLTGTDRVAEVAKLIPAGFYINVQGDEPLFNPADILCCIDACRAFPGEIINGYAPIESIEDYTSRSIPKVVFRNDRRLLYMSRSPIPGNKSGKFKYGFRQICAYGFSKESLFDFTTNGQKTQFEQEEDIEILRFLEMGYDVRMVEMSPDSVSVDTELDYQKVIRILSDSINP